MLKWLAASIWGTTAAAADGTCTGADAALGVCVMDTTTGSESGSDTESQSAEWIDAAPAALDADNIVTIIAPRRRLYERRTGRRIVVDAGSHVLDSEASLKYAMQGAVHCALNERGLRLGLPEQRVAGAIGRKMQRLAHASDMRQHASQERMQYECEYGQ